MPKLTADNCENMYPCWSYKEQRDYRGRHFNIHIASFERGHSVPRQCDGAFLLRDGVHAAFEDVDSYGGQKEFVVRQSIKTMEKDTKAVDLAVGITIDLPVQLTSEQTKHVAEQIAKIFDEDRPVLWVIHGNNKLHPHLHLLMPTMAGVMRNGGADGWEVDAFSPVVFSRPGELNNFRAMVAGVINDALEKADYIGDWFPSGTKDPCELAQAERDLYEKEHRVAKEALGDFISKWGEGATA